MIVTMITAGSIMCSILSFTLHIRMMQTDADKRNAQHEQEQGKQVDWPMQHLILQPAAPSQFWEPQCTCLEEQ